MTKEEFQDHVRNTKQAIVASLMYEARVKFIEGVRAHDPALARMFEEHENGLRRMLRYLQERSA